MEQISKEFTKSRIKVNPKYNVWIILSHHQVSDWQSKPNRRKTKNTLWKWRKKNYIYQFSIIFPPPLRTVLHLPENTRFYDCKIFVKPCKHSKRPPRHLCPHPINFLKTIKLYLFGFQKQSFIPPLPETDLHTHGLSCIGPRKVRRSWLLEHGIVGTFKTLYEYIMSLRNSYSS